MRERQRGEPYLVQRVQLNTYPREGSKGVDAIFGFSYMGAAEFEYGALSTALGAMRANLKDIEAEPVRIEDTDTPIQERRVCWFVGPRDKVAFATEFFADQSYDRREIRLMERTQMSYAYQPERPEDADQAPIGWWAIDQEIPWLLFVNKEDASEWLARLEK